MNKPFHLPHAMVAAALALGLAGAASAQSTWNLSLQSCDPTGSSTATTAGCTVGGVTATVTGWSSSNSDMSSLLVRATLTDQGSSGIGITSSSETSGSPNHAIDSSGQDELVLVSFGTDKVSLTGVTTGWSAYDTDLSVLRWTHSTGPDLSTMSLTGGSTGLIAKGWQLIKAEDLDGVSGDISSNDGTDRNMSISGAPSSSWWIISAYFGGAGTGALGTGNDYFKLLSFTGTCTSNIHGGACGTINNPNTSTGAVPEPSSLGLALAALLGLGYSRRRPRA